MSALVITDQDVITVLDQDDQIASATSAAFAALGSAVPSATAAAWASTLAQYQAFATPTRAAVSGGFFAGAWWGVPDMYGNAVNWGKTLTNYANTAKGLGAQLPALPTTPAPSTPVGGPDLSGANPVSSLATKALIGLGLVAAIVIARKL